jgi:chaperone required for assembly of F1-ATPase
MAALSRTSTKGSARLVRVCALSRDHRMERRSEARESGVSEEGSAGRPVMRPELPRRFYAAVSVEPRPEGEALLLDGRPVQTPGKRPVAVPSPALAEAVADEWRAQGERIDPSTMPLTRLVNVALDGVATQTDRVAEEITRYAGSDLVCYRADGPQGLVTRQSQHWDPLIRWAAETLGARLLCVEGVVPVAQSEPALSSIRAHLARLDPFRLAAVHAMTTLTGSAVIALAVLKGRLSPDEAWRAAHVDEDWNIAQWGEDAEAAAARAARRIEMGAAARLLSLL